MTDLLNILFLDICLCISFLYLRCINYKVIYNHRIGSKISLPGMRSQVNVSCFNSIINSEEKSLLVMYFVLRYTIK